MLAIAVGVAVGRVFIVTIVVKVPAPVSGNSMRWRVGSFLEGIVPQNRDDSFRER
jgi:hypothetical protein